MNTNQENFMIDKLSYTYFYNELKECIIAYYHCYL